MFTAPDALLGSADAVRLRLLNGRPRRADRKCEKAPQETALRVSSISAIRRI